MTGKSHGKPEAPRPATLLRRQAVGHDRQEEDVVDAKNDLQRGQGNQAGPGVGIEEKLVHLCLT